ncbi:MAG: CDP-alcohol phosphatidyltransferase family protein [Angelakisella sp.]
MLLKQIPNGLSVLRLLMIPVIVYSYLNAVTEADFLLCGVLLVVSGITDIVDGVIARSFSLVSNLGKVLDPLADKLTQFAVIFMLCIRHHWLWPLAALLLVKDAAMGICGIYLYRCYKHINAARWYGKAATVIFYLVTIALAAFPDLLGERNLLVPAALIFGSMLFAGVMYAASTLRYLKKSRAEAAVPVRDND